ncbi:hypothetical protein GCM10008968_13280 [Bacillus horti]
MVQAIYNESWIKMREQYAHLTFQDHATFNTLQLEMFAPQKGRLLEIGSGTGEFLHMAKHAGWDVTGLEPSSLSCRYAMQHYQLELIPTILTDELANRLEPFEAIAIWHVLEHVPKPVAFLNQVADLLKDDGVLFFSVPNLKSFMNTSYGAHSPIFTEVDHLYHYSEKSIPLLLEHTPFSIEALFTRQLANQLEQIYRKKFGASSLKLEAKMALMSNLQGQGKGHEICCVARKRNNK